MQRIIIALILCGALQAFAGELMLSFSVTGKADDKQFEFNLAKSNVAKTPVWPEGAENPPLAPRQALEIARKQLQKFVKNPDEWPLHQICLVDLGDHLHWIYEVDFLRNYPDDKAVFGADYFNIPVFMDGTVMVPEVISLHPQ